MLKESIVLPVGLDLEGVLQRHLTMRESTVMDMLRAEDQVACEKTISFNLAQASMQILSVGEIKGPFTLEETMRWNKHDVNAVMKVWETLEKKSLAAVIEKNLNDSGSLENSGSQVKPLRAEESP